MSSQKAGLDASVEAKAAEILQLRKQVAEANQKVAAQAERRPSLIDVSLDAPEPEPEPAPAATMLSLSPAQPAAPAAAEPEPELSTPRVSELEITATFITDGALGLHFKEDSDPACLVLGVNGQGLAAKQPQIKPGLVLKAVNRKPVEGVTFDQIIYAMTKAPRPLELSFWHSAPAPQRVISASVVGTKLVAGEGWLSSSTTEYVIEAQTESERTRTISRTYTELKMVHLGWVEPLSAVGMQPTFPVDVMFGANDDVVVKERRLQLQVWLTGALRMAETLSCPLLDDALQRALTASLEARSVGLGPDHVRAHLATVVQGALPPGPRSGIANVWDCRGYWTWGSADDFAAQLKSTPGTSYRPVGADPTGSPGRGPTIPHVLEIGEFLEGESLPAIVKAQKLDPDVWGSAPAGSARLLVKDGPQGGELRINGAWKSAESGSKLSLEVYSIDVSDCWGHTWSRKAVKQLGGKKGAVSAVQWIDVTVKALPQVRDLKICTDAAGNVEKFGLETSGLWKGAKIVAVNQAGVSGNVAIFEALNKVDDSGAYGQDLTLTFEVAAEIVMSTTWRKEVVSLEHLGWTRQLVREQCSINGVGYGGEQVAICIKIDELCITSDGFCSNNDGLCILNDDFNTNGQAVACFGFGDCYQLPTVMRAEAFSGQTGPR